MCSNFRGKVEIAFVKDIHSVGGCDLSREDCFFSCLSFNHESSRLAAVQGEIRVGSSYQASRFPHYLFKGIVLLLVLLLFFLHFHRFRGRLSFSLWIRANFHCKVHSSEVLKVAKRKGREGREEGSTFAIWLLLWKALVLFYTALRWVALNISIREQSVYGRGGTMDIDTFCRPRGEG